jgi:transcriptional regulator with XRE-family HTH domain
MEPKVLKAIITERGIKQTFIAKKLNVSKGLVNQWIKETSPISEKHQVELRSLLSN